ncbi:NB-ARC domain-containing protein [Micromonospora echinospora]|uniref:NB-ARC domain-containing protein n=1 Tax=Micromonospora echinospora TaxID=1877 RepID=UPI003A8607BB
MVVAVAAVMLAPSGTSAEAPTPGAAVVTPPVGPGSIVVGGDITGIASTGDHATNTQNVTVLSAEALVAPEGVPAPAGLVNLPVRRRLFVGREDALGWLDSVARDPGVVVVQAVHGLGGIGKSTLVAQWAATHRDDYRPIWWITADSPAALDAGLVALTVALRPGLGAVLPSSALQEWAVRWLGCHDGWLLILDNVTDPGHITDLLARLPHGRILVTSRRATGWPDIVTPLRLDVLEPQQAVDLLTGIVSRADAVIDPADAAGVCAELGYLPLAVEQAGAYLAETGVTAGDYLRLLAQHPADMYRDGGEGRASERTVARVWQVTLDALADDPLPGRLLRALAWYAPEVIPAACGNTPATAMRNRRWYERSAGWPPTTCSPSTPPAGRSRCTGSSRPSPAPPTPTTRTVNPTTSPPPAPPPPPP